MSKEKEQKDKRKAELQEDASSLSDIRLIDDILGGELEPKERKVFESMCASLSRASSTGLSVRQRSWAEKVYVSCYLKDENRVHTEKIIPTGKVPTFWWEEKSNHPLKPPGK